MRRRFALFNIEVSMRRLVALLLCLGLLSTLGCKRYEPNLHHNLNTTNAYTLVSNEALDITGRLQLMFLGNTNVYLSDGNTQLLIDGFFTRPGGWWSVLLGSFEPDMPAIEQGLQRAGIKQLDAVLVGHTHYDHVMDAPLVALETRAKLVGTRSAYQVARRDNFPEERFVEMPQGSPLTLGDFTVSHVRSRHGEPSFKPFAKLGAGEIKEPPPRHAHFSHYKEGGVYAIHLAHPFGNVLVVTSSGYEEGALHGYEADTVFLSVAALGHRGERYIRDYVQQTVETVKASTVVPVHWDDFTRPLDEPLVVMPSRITDVAQAMATLRQLEQEADGRWRIFWPPAFIKWLAAQR